MRMQITFVAIVTFPLLGAAVDPPITKHSVQKSFAHRNVHRGQIKDILLKEQKSFKVKTPKARLQIQATFIDKACKIMENCTSVLLYFVKFMP